MILWDEDFKKLKTKIKHVGFTMSYSEADMASYLCSIASIQKILNGEIKRIGEILTGETRNEK